MEKQITNAQIYELAKANGYNYGMLKAIIAVESGQHGFSEKTGRLIIQFEKTWFKRQYADWKKDTEHTLWQSNGVGDQTNEWAAFNSAYKENPDAAMKSTSIGMMQIMGFHYAECGFSSVKAMWEFCVVSEYNQVLVTMRWAKTQKALNQAIINKNFNLIALYYNGQDYKSFHYDTRLAAAYRLTEDFAPLKKAV